MVRLGYILMASVSVFMYGSETERITIASHQQQATQMRLAVVSLSDQVGHDALFDRVACCLGYSGHLVVDRKQVKQLPQNRASIREWFKKGYELVLFIAQEKQKISWRLYDSAEGAMLYGKKAPISDVRDFAYAISADIFKQLTNQETPFFSKIAYIKKQNRRSILCLADFDGSNEQNLVSSRSILVAPCWGVIDGEPVIFYSEFTSRNVRICVTDMHGSHKPIVDLEGTSVGLSLQHGRHEGVYARSGALWLWHYDEKRGTARHSIIVKNVRYPCASPILLANGDIIYCSNGKIQHYDRVKKQSRIVTQGYSVSPALHNKSGKLAYVSRTNGIMQVWLYDYVSHDHRQVTFDAGDKTEVSWSPCGHYVLFLRTIARDESLVVHHVETGARTVLPVVAEYPSWSPLLVFRLDNIFDKIEK